MARQQRADGPDKRTGSPAWIAVAGYVTAVLTLVFFMGAVFAAIVGHQVPAGSHFLVVAVLSLGLALSVGFIGGSAAAEGKLPVPGLSEHPVKFSLAGGIAAFFLCLMLGMQLYPESVQPAPQRPGQDPLSDDSPGRFDLKFSVAFDALFVPTPTSPKPNLSFKQRLPSDGEPENIAFQTAYYLVKNIGFPRRGERYLADFRPSVLSSQFVASGQAEPLYTLCFQRKLQDPPHSLEEARRYAVMRCLGQPHCSVDDELDQKWIDPCEERHGFDFRSLVMGRAFAQAGASAAADSPHWRVPSLDTLLRRNRDRLDGAGYTRFEISGHVRADGTTHVGLGIKANGTPVYIDGWSPRDLRRPWDPSRPLEFEFGLENLDFAGGDDGREKLEAELIFYRNDEVVKRTLLNRRIVALRDAPAPEQVVASDGQVFTWSGTYMPPIRQDKFSIMVVSTTDLGSVQRVKQRIDAVDVRFDDQRMVGVLRPPLTPWRLQSYANPNYAVLIGLKQQNGQVRFTFDEQLANQLCKTIYRERSNYRGAVLENVFRYEWPPVTTRKYLLCRTL